MMTNVALIGFGYWGPNLARNFSKNKNCYLTYICEQHTERAAAAAAEYPACQVIEDISTALDDPTIHLIAIATPVSSHFELAKRAILSGKDVFVEKPLADTPAKGQELVELAKKHQRILAVDHTFLFTPAVRKIKELVESNTLGPIRYFDAVRVNLGLFQSDSNVMSDLGPHDISILEYIFSKSPTACRAVGGCQAGTNYEDVTYLHLEYEDGMIAHFHWNWLAPVKIRKTLICGSKKMIVYDDLEQSEKLKIYDKGVEICHDAEQKNKLLVDYRIGDMLSPKLETTEALAFEIEHLHNCIINRNTPESDGNMGVRVLNILDAAQRSLSASGERVTIDYST